MFKVTSEILIILLLYSNSMLAGNTGSMKGCVSDAQTGKPLVYAFVRIVGTDLCAMVNDSGEYFIDSIPPGTFEVIVEGRSHITERFSGIDIPADSIMIFNAKLGYVLIPVPSHPSFGFTPDELRRLMPEDGPYLKSSIMDEGKIPARYTCDGANVSPPFWIKNLPDETKSLVLICDTLTSSRRKFVQWIVYNIPPDIGKIPEGIEKSLFPNINKKSGKMKITQGINDFGEFGYDGPCLKFGTAQTYFFRVYALDKILGLSKYEERGGNNYDVLSKAMEGHILAKVGLTGRYWKE